MIQLLVSSGMSFVIVKTYQTRERKIPLDALHEATTRQKSIIVYDDSKQTVRLVKPAKPVSKDWEKALARKFPSFPSYYSQCAICECRLLYHLDDSQITCPRDALSISEFPVVDVPYSSACWRNFTTHHRKGVYGETHPGVSPYAILAFAGLGTETTFDSPYIFRPGYCRECELHTPATRSYVISRMRIVRYAYSQKGGPIPSVTELWGDLKRKLYMAGLITGPQFATWQNP